VSVLFVSHASKDDALADALEAWLKAHGFTDLFIDHTSIAGGAKWAEALRAQTGAARVVVCLVTPNWLSSRDCEAEFMAAWYLGKRIIPLYHLPEMDALNDAQRTLLRKVRAEDQGIDLRPLIDAEGRLDFAGDEGRADVLRRGLRAAGALSTVGLDPHVFETNKKTHPMPFPGLRSFGDDDADAALFFGRSREIAAALEILREMRANNKREPLVILGASGAGKSSLLKAGIIPRLRREAPAWIPLRAFRPGADPMLNFAEAITRTLADFGVTQAHGALKRDLLEAWRAAARDTMGALTGEGRTALAQALGAQAERLRAAAARPEATLLLAIDQAEELARSDGENGEALADFLRAAMDAEGAWRLVFTIRTDSFPELQNHRRFRNLEARGYDLRALPVFRFSDVVEAPAKRYGVEIDPALVDALMEDSPKDDALPLLAFALQRLWDQFAADGALRLADYRAMGGLSGLIEDAAERALTGIEPEQRDTPLAAEDRRKLYDALGARTFVPPLADVNDDGAAIRRVAEWTSFDPEQQAMLDRFDRWRLVVRKGAEAGAGTVEVAHEALFREWTRLKTWLEPERGRLEALRGLKLAAAAWERKGRSGDFLTHTGKRLQDAAALTGNPRYARQLDGGQTAYLSTAGKAERRSTLVRRGLMAVAGVATVAVVVGSLWSAYKFEIDYAVLRWNGAAPKSASEIAALEPLAAFKECKGPIVCPEMMVVPAGKFLMGSPATEAGRDEDEGPQREVTIAKAFAVGKFEVTFADWEACVAGTKLGSLPADETAPRIGCATVSDSGYGKGKRPVINVSWHEAQGYVRWLNQTLHGRVDGPYRLLSEAEWEHAARAATTTAYSFGDDAKDICAYGNVLTEKTKQWYPGFQGDTAPCEDGQIKTAEAGSFKANAFGLHDMHGNVWEWVQDCHGPYAEASNDGSVTEKANCSIRVLRGGSWSFTPRYLRSADRYSYGPIGRGNVVGFRLARTL
jgi:formylglycine-generating enzyme required for sulfatase activity